ncbi:MAG: hypothetical protein A2538_04030 [Candidatus Magasanikbacteria bacterium RIFOXYD2_FULL_41_14]|uniref:Uncharacterized protein n=1 Tax=Candidatus Magasanikbacteria bacterium RIFOXYD2_FULL_41_14 TaxID=1798709 RepID=A0A1F6PG17_9BACT|nr:MAG: hypothetical protein A2538_04030 [Candidatus Magasanikbacteria bacterium RIFOXYD2_FULL_41_14]
MADNNEETAATNGLSKEQKIGFVLLLCFAIFAITLGVLQIRNTMRRPFALSNAVPGTVKDEVNNADALRFRDTDRDGLSDFDELYVYGTSPYLADSDSDGVSDKNEVTVGSDPLCASGKDCLNNPIAVENFSPASSTVMPALVLEEPIDMLSTNLGSILTDPAQIRVMLKDAGLSVDILNGLSDSDLLSWVAEALSASSTSETSDSTSILNSLISSSTNP